MEIKWPNVAAMALLLGALVLVLSHPEKVGRFIGAMQSVTFTPALDDRAMGVLGLGIVTVGIVAVTKILSTSGRQGPGR